MLTNSRSISRKEVLRKDLLNRDLSAIEMKAVSGKNILRTLSSLLYDEDSLIRWRAIEALGRASAVIARGDLEKIRRQIRRILWLMNDESGGLCWNGPEAIGEILYNISSLIPDYGPILTQFLQEEPFEAGSRRAIARAAEKNPDIFRVAIPKLIESLKSDDPDIRGSSIMALNSLKNNSAGDIQLKLRNDQSIFEQYDFDTGNLNTMTIAELINQYLARTG